MREATVSALRRKRAAWKDRIMDGIVKAAESGHDFVTLEMTAPIVQFLGPWLEDLGYRVSHPKLETAAGNVMVNVSWAPDVGSLIADALAETIYEAP
jgi:hypothetical protein